MKIVVTTPTGNVGSRVVRLLLQAGTRPTLLMRHPEKLDEQTAKLVDVVQGDQLDKDDVLRATEGADALYWVDPPGGEDPIATYALAGSHAAAAIREHGSPGRCFRAVLARRNASAQGRSTGSPVPRNCLTRSRVGDAPARDRDARGSDPRHVDGTT